MAVDGRNDSFWSNPTMPLYCVIVTHPFTTQKKPFNVIIATNPSAAVIAHNTETSTATGLREAAPFCYIKRAAGPFRSRLRIIHFVRELVLGIRGLDSTVRKIEKLSQKYRVECYSDSVNLNEPIPDYFRRQNVPMKFIDAAEALEQAAHVLLNRR